MPRAFTRRSWRSRAPRAATRGRRSLLLCAATLLAAACAGSGSADNPADSFADTLARGQGTIEVRYVEAPGFAYLDAEGRLTGVTVELMRLFAAHVEHEHGVALRVAFAEEADWRTFYAGVRDAGSGVFGIGNVTITEPRGEELQFSPPYLYNVAVLITHASVPELPSMDRLGSAFAGMRPLAYAGTLHEDRLEALRREHMPDVELERAQSNAEIMRRVGEGPEYFAYIDAYNYWREVAAGAALRHHPVADEAGEQFGVIMPLMSDWAPAMRAFFAADGGLLDRPEYRRLLNDHLGEALAAQLIAARPQATSAAPAND
jgi:ABC-type amino acid transport substrate-binding protein